MNTPAFALSLSKGIPSLSSWRRGKVGLRQAQPERFWGFATAFLLVLAAAPAAAQEFPPLTGRVVDQAELIPSQTEAELAQRLQALEQATTRQLVIATIPDLQGYDIRDYGYQLGRHWGIGREDANNGVILLVAPNERRVAIEVGYGLEPIVTDALSSRIIREAILPRFREDDYPGGIVAGTGALIEQLQAPPEAAEQRALEAAAAERAEEGGSIFPLIFWLIVLFFVIIPMLRSGFGGRRYRGRRRGFGGPVIIWGPGMGGGWGGGSRGGGFGGGGFSGGGGSFGGGGASGGW